MTKDSAIRVDRQQTVGADSGTVAFTIPTGGSGYYAVKVHVVPGTAEDGNDVITDLETPKNIAFSDVVWSTNGPLFAHQPVADYDLNMGSAPGVRMFGCSIMYTNTSSAQYRNGELTGVQMAQDSHWEDEIINLSKVSGYNKARTFNADKGIYGYLKPTKLDDFAIQSNLQLYDGHLVDSKWPLFNSFAYLLVVGNIDGASAALNAPSGQKGTWVSHNSLEYESLDTWRNVGKPGKDDKLFSAAIAKLSDYEQWTHNPTHVKDIISAISKGAHTVGEVTNVISDIAGVFGV